MRIRQTGGKLYIAHKPKYNTILNIETYTIHFIFYRFAFPVGLLTTVLAVQLVHTLQATMIYKCYSSKMQ